MTPADQDTPMPQIPADLPATQYFTGKPCPRDHIAPRYRSSRACVECQRERARARVAANPEQTRARRREYGKTHRVQLRARSKEYRTANRDVVLARFRTWHDANRDWFRAYHANRKAQRFGIAEAITDADIALVRERHGWVCLRCGTDEA